MILFYTLVLVAINILLCRLSSASICAVSVPSANLSSSDIVDIVKFVQSQNTAEKIIDVAVTELEVVKQVINYNQGKNNEDVRLNIKELIIKYGYTIEEHKVTTKDGYILTLYRIPGNGSVVFLMHGVLGSADDFVTAGPDNALVYVLASHGYDIWLGNARGNKHSRKHETLSPECSEFWDFSWHEIGIYDLPAMIDFALDKSGQTKLAYIGFSQGTTSFFVMASMLPEYNSKISVMIALAPVAYMSHLKGPLYRILSLETELAFALLKAIGVNEVAPDDALTKALATVLCGNNPLAEIICSNFVFLLSGFDRGQFNATNLPVILGHMPAGSSTKQVAHYGQEIQSAKFRMFDYGVKRNEELYGVPSPPEYSVKNITAPVSLFYSENDWLSSDIDVTILRDQLPNVVKFYLAEKYCHLDYVWATNVKEKINMPILELIKRYE